MGGTTKIEAEVDVCVRCDEDEELMYLRQALPLLGGEGGKEGDDHLFERLMSCGPRRHN
jgi:hypothetical protein